MINKFEKEYEYLSNFYRASFMFMGKEWPTVEHAYQALKSNERPIQEHVRGLSTPRAAKQAGRKLVMRNDWPDISYNVMRELVRAKFVQNEDIAKKLSATGDEEIVEGNYWHDQIWGDCSCEKCSNFEGMNQLGSIIMQVRSSLQECALCR